MRRAAIPMNPAELYLKILTVSLRISRALIERSWYSWRWPLKSIVPNSWRRCLGPISDPSVLIVFRIENEKGNPRNETGRVKNPRNWGYLGNVDLNGNSRNWRMKGETIVSGYGETREIDERKGMNVGDRD